MVIESKNETYMSALKTLFLNFLSNKDKEVKNNCGINVEKIIEEETPGVISNLENDIINRKYMCKRDSHNNLKGETKISLRTTGDNKARKEVSKDEIEVEVSGR